MVPGRPAGTWVTVVDAYDLPLLEMLQSKPSFVDSNKTDYYR
jgi:hypothetical protein